MLPARTHLAPVPPDRALHSLGPIAAPIGSPDEGSGRPGRAHQTLRDATAAAHRALDHHPLLQRLTDSDLTREQYAESLAAMYRPHVQLERLVHGSRHLFASGLKLSTRRRLLEADLLELGRPVPALPPSLPDPLNGRAAWWGRVYVLEGSRLGGAFIARRVRSWLGDSVPCRFLAETLAPDLQRAMQVMRERQLEAPEALDQAVAGARAAFAAYQVGLDCFDSGPAPSSRSQGK